MRVPVDSPYAGGRPLLQVCRNGAPPDALAVRGLGDYLHMIAGARMKLLFAKDVSVSDAASLAGTQTTWRWMCHTSPNMVRLHAAWTLLPTNDVTNTLNPTAWLQSRTATISTNPATLGGVTSHAAVYVNARKTAAAVPDDYLYHRQVISGLAGNTTYAFYLNVRDKCRVKALSVYEESRDGSTLDPDTETAMDVSELAIGGTIFDRDLTDLLTHTHTMWKRQGSNEIFWTVPSVNAATTSLSTYANIHDAAVTSWQATAPGYYTWPYRRGSYDSNNVPAMCYAFGKSSSTSSECSVQFITYLATNGTVTSIVSAPAGDSNGAWYVAVASHAAGSSSEKIDIHFKTGGGPVSLSLFAAGMFEYLA